MTRHRCIVWAVVGCLAGCAAYAQDPAAPLVPAAPDGMALLLQLLQAGGLPAVLGAGGWLLGRGGIPITVQLSEPDRELLRRVARHLAKAIDDAPPKDDSLDKSDGL